MRSDGGTRRGDDDRTSNAGVPRSSILVACSPSYQHPLVIGRLHHVILDCPDPQVLAQFYSALLGHPVTHRSDDFCVAAASSEVSGLAFQRIAQHVAPTWPDQAVPQQLHLDVMVDDVEAARPAVVQLGAHLLKGDVYADPAGHPFCLIPRPSWADSVS